jgi:hypothetical protein
MCYSRYYSSLEPQLSTSTPQVTDNWHQIGDYSYTDLYETLRVSKIPNMGTARTIQATSHKETETSLHSIGSKPTLVLTRCSLLHLFERAQMAVKLGKQWGDPEQSITPQEPLVIAISHLTGFRWAEHVARMGQTRNMSELYGNRASAEGRIMLIRKLRIKTWWKLDELLELSQNRTNGDLLWRSS